MSCVFTVVNVKMFFIAKIQDFSLNSTKSLILYSDNIPTWIRTFPIIKSGETFLFALFFSNYVNVSHNKKNTSLFLRKRKLVIKILQTFSNKFSSDVMVQYHWHRGVEFDSLESRESTRPRWLFGVRPCELGVNQKRLNDSVDSESEDLGLLYRKSHGKNPLMGELWENTQYSSWRIR